MLVNTAGLKTTLNAIKEYIRKQTIYLKSYVHEQISSSYQTFKSLIKQPDWNQNNINASDYVKNRTHYSIGRWADLTFDNMRNKPDIRFVLIEGRKYEVTNTSIGIAYAYYDIEDLYQIVVGFRDQYVRLKKIENNMQTDDNSECKVWLEDVHPIHRVFLPNGNIVNGSAEGSIRGYHTSEESSSYTMGRHSHAEGSSTKSSGDYSHAEGSSTESSGESSHAEGLGTKSSGESSHAEGLRAESSGVFSHAEGVDSKSVGGHSHAEGDRTKSSGKSSHAEGCGTESSGDYSHAEGSSTKSSGVFSHAEGLSTESSGNYSHAEGDCTKSSGDFSHAEGSCTKAKGNYAHAEGLCTIANATQSHAQGKYNKEDSSGTYAHIVGNGTSDTKRSNAHTLDWSGNAWFAGDVYVRSTSGTDKDEGSKKLATEEYVDTAKTEAQQLGLTAATPGQIIKVKTVQDGKPTEWEAVNPDYTLTVTVNTQDGVTVTGQTVTVRAGDADGPVYGTAEYNGQPVSFRVPDGFAYYAEVTDNLAAHFNPTTVKGVINGANAAVTLLYKDFSTIQTAPDIQAALNADMDLTELVGQQITCQRGNDTLSWDVVDYDSVAKVVTLCTHDVLPDIMQFEPNQALMYCEDGLVAGSYTFKWNNTQCYFTLTQAIPVGGQLLATNSAFQTYESTTATTQIESGTVSTETIDGATNLGQTGTGNLNHHDRVKNGSNNFGESGILQWLNSDSPANTPMPRLTKFSRPYVPTKAGFKADLDAEFLACIQDTTWKCSANNVYECPVSLGGIAQKDNPYTVTAKFALASEIEVFGEYGGEYGGVQDGGTVWGLYVGAEATDRIKYYNNTARGWCLRSPYWNNSFYVRNVKPSGVGNANDIANRSNWVAVACKIAKSN